MKDDGGTMEILVATEHGHVSLTISDTGCGIPPSDVGNIFDPYYTSKSTGTGLGLSIVHKIIEAHGGKIDVDSTLGRGTTFKIQLPHISR
jgi:two-component system sensor histidine kinase HydH